MFGLKEQKPGRGKFLFDLEIQIKDHPAEGKKLLEKATARMQQVKTALREGVSENDFDKLGVLLHGYTALQKVLKKLNQ